MSQVDLTDDKTRRSCDHGFVQTPRPDWAAIYAEHGQAMRLAARAQMGGSDKTILGKTADDVVGDLIRDLMARGTDFDGVHDIRSYLCVAIRNKVTDLRRKPDRETPADLDPDDLDDKTDIEEEVCRQELARLAVASLSELGERQRLVLEERVMKCRRAKDVADDLGVTPQRIAQILNDALTQLRSLPIFHDIGNPHEQNR